MSEKAQVLLIGGGNASHVLASILTSRGYRVHMLSTFADEAERIRTAAEANGGIECKSDVLGEVKGLPALITNDPSKAVPNSKIVLLSLPAFAHEVYLRAIEPFVEPGMIIGALPGQGGFDSCVRDVLGEKGEHVTVFATETLPWACRIVSPGTRVEVLGTKKDIDVAVSPGDAAESTIAQLQDMIGPAPVLHAVPNCLSVTMMNINSVWHPCITYGRYRDWDGTPFDTPPLFYEGVDEYTADLLTAVSDEVLAVKAVIEQRYPDCNLSGVAHVRDWMARSYAGDIADDSTLYRAINTNKGYKGLTHPTVTTDDGKFLPNWKYRYLAEDIPFGLSVTRGIAQLAGVPTPNMDKVIAWAQEKLGKEFLVGDKLQGKDVATGTRAPQRYNFDDLHAYMVHHKYTKLDKPAA